MHDLLKNMLAGGTLVVSDRAAKHRMTILLNKEGDILLVRKDADETVTHYMLRPDDKLLPIPLIEEGCLERARAACPA
jgi:hypothetical protein